MSGKLHEGHYVVEVLPGLWTNANFDNLELFQPDDGGEVYIIFTGSSLNTKVIFEAHVPVRGTTVVIRFPNLVGVWNNERPWNLLKRMAEKIYVEETRHGKTPKKIIVSFKASLSISEPVKIVHEF